MGKRARISVLNLNRVSGKISTILKLIFLTGMFRLAGGEHQLTRYSVACCGEYH